MKYDLIGAREGKSDVVLATFGTNEDAVLALNALEEHKRAFNETLAKTNKAFDKAIRQNPDYPASVEVRTTYFVRPVNV